MGEFLLYRHSYVINKLMFSDCTSEKAQNTIFISSEIGSVHCHYG